MAIGDDAAAAGMPLVPGTLPSKDLDTADNETRDFVAQGHARWKSGVVLPISKGGTGATSASAARTALDVVASGITVQSNGAYDVGLVWSGSQLQLFIDGVFAGYIGGAVDLSNYVQKSGDTMGGGLTVNGALVNPHARSNGVSSWLALGVNPSGQLGFQLSSRRFKKDIKSWTPDKQAILAMRLVEFRYKVAYDDTGEIDHGLIAEELHDLGLTWLVAYDADDLPVTVRYDRIGLALLGVVQDHEARIAALEAR